MVLRASTASSCFAQTLSLSHLSGLPGFVQHILEEVLSVASSSSNLTLCSQAQLSSRPGLPGPCYLRLSPPHLQPPLRPPCPSSRLRDRQPVSQGPDEHVQRGGVTGSKDGSSRSPGGRHLIQLAPDQRVSACGPRSPEPWSRLPPVRPSCRTGPSASEISVC